ncbi:Chorismate synthase [Corynebacterium pseudotuberculosis]|uniref:Chorismate synthase n=2 Tax=Corynebacterium pseudotuberculosis TaxID=1719 RepID=A0AAU8PM43_CORPS|nr:chorismate synthase [Corynebacterium pseudotuberculosis CIP 52.97]AER69193.1 Chorismate synthase [Corynebacterium pseudotuberculosis 1/06-A]AFB72495.1 chorismate synthase [Corynebacterium pseudotuberculosis 316]AFH90964.2 chorismate synthase [Corynebacterium pseudotuberculosis 31]AFK16791.1 chorismate synthase [Corynebacterium pseudotuberculosis 258]AKS13484.1 Chorismate synthase [Corynebacterium pseudotuberculosis]
MQWDGCHFGTERGLMSCLHAIMRTMLRWTTSGESHGQALVAMLENMPAGVSISREDISAQLARRRLGYGRGARMKFEADEVTILGGVRHGKTLGSPIAIMIGNTEWPKWTAIMAADPLDPDDQEAIDAMNSGRGARLTRPRPGHADFSGMIKYDFDEARPVLERSSARETAARVAAGTVARALLREVFNVDVISYVVSIGRSEPYEGPLPSAADLDKIDASPVRAADAVSESSMVSEIEQAKKQGDTLGGIVEVVVSGLPIGLGSHVSGDDRLDAQLAAALMSIQAIKGVEIGDGFEEARRRGTEAHDEIVRTADGIQRLSNRAGGLEGGMTNGETLRLRAAMKPISTVPRALKTIDMTDGKPATGIHQRSDVCAVPAAGVVAESMVALVLARAALEKFGGDSVTETKRNVNSYLEYVKSRLGFDTES